MKNAIAVDKGVTQKQKCIMERSGFVNAFSKTVKNR